MKTKTIIALSLLAFSTAQGATILSEAVDGDFSDDHLNPTNFPLEVGVNSLSLTIGGGPIDGGGATNGSDADIVLFNLPAGGSISSILVTLSEGGAHFFGAEFGDAFTLEPASSTAFADSLDAQAIFSQGDDLVNTFLVDPTQDFVALFQETANPRNAVTVDVTVVPEPSSTLLTLGAIVIGLGRRRRS